MSEDIKVISVEKGKKLYTKDGWKSFDITRTIEGTSEIDSDIIFKVRLRYYFINNEKKAYIIIDELDKIRNKYYKKKNDAGYGSSFEIFAISVLYNISYEEAYTKYIIQGNEDGGIDAIYWNSEKITLYQIKEHYDEKFDKKRMQKNFQEYLKNERLCEKDLKHLTSFIDKNRSELEKEFEIKLISHVKHSDIKIEHIYDKYFNNCLFGTDNDIVLKVDYYNSEDDEYVVAKNNENIYALFINAKKLIDSLICADNVGSPDKIEKYFDNNVRGELSRNKNMVNTIMNDPLNFVNYNNGITISGIVKHQITQKLFIIENPTITNGQQTIRTLIDNVDKLDDVCVLLILKNVGDNNISLIRNIAKYTNSQTKVKELDLLSINEHVRTLKKQLYKNGSGFYLDIHYSGDNLMKKTAKKIYGKNNIIKLKDFIKLYFSSDDNKIGEWKNSVSKMIEKSIINSFDIKKSIKVCKCISDFSILIKSIKDKERKDNYKLADLAMMNICLNRNISINDASKIIDHILKDYFDGKYPDFKTIKDLFRSNNIYTLLKEYK